MFSSRPPVVAVVLSAALLPLTAGTVDAPSVSTLNVGIVADNGPAGAALMAGATRAANDWNAERHAPRLRLFPVRAARAWDDSASALARVAFEQDLAAIVGAHDSATAHAAAQVATVKRIPFLTVAPEDGLTRVFDPWIFRGVPADTEQADALLRWAFAGRSHPRVALLVPPGRPGRVRTDALEAACTRLDVEIATRIVVAPDAPADLDDALDADAVLLWLDTDPARTVVAQLRDAGFAGAVLGSSRLDNPAFRGAGDGVALPQFAPLQPRRAHMLERQSGALVRAVAVAAETGLDPGAIRAALAGGSPPGPVRFDERGNRLGEIRVGVVSRGFVNLTPSPRRGPS